MILSLILAISVEDVSESRHLKDIEAVNDLSEDKPESGSEEIMAIFHAGLADEGSACSDTMSASESSVKSSSLLLVLSSIPKSFLWISFVDRNKKCKGNIVEDSASTNEETVFLLMMNRHPELWPPDSL